MNYTMYDFVKYISYHITHLTSTFASYLVNLVHSPNQIPPTTWYLRLVRHPCTLLLRWDRIGYLGTLIQLITQNERSEISIVVIIALDNFYPFHFPKLLLWGVRRKLWWIKKLTVILLEGAGQPGASFNILTCPYCTLLSHLARAEWPFKPNPR